MLENREQSVIGSWIVCDPTGRDLESCYEVGIVTAVSFCEDDDGDAAGHARPILTVRLNSGETMGITTVAHVLYPAA